MQPSPIIRYMNRTYVLSRCQVNEIDVYADRFGLRSLLSRGLYRELELERHARGSPVIRSGDEADRLLFFVEGRAKTFRVLENGNVLVVRFSEPFDVIGEAELFSQGGYVLDIEAVYDCVFLSLRSALVRAQVDDNARLLAELCARLGRKLTAFNVASAINLRYPVENRLAGYLAGLGDGERATLSLGELADALGTSYRQLSRVVGRFRDEGILERARGSLIVRDSERLRELTRDSYA